MKKLIVAVDDESDILELLELSLIKAGYNVKTFLNGSSFFDFTSKNTPDLVLLDVMLPGEDGFDICKRMRKESKLAKVPVIMLTAKTEEFDKVLGLELGADDYVTKPFSPRELMARVKAVMRRHEAKEETEVLEVGNILTIDLTKYEVIVAGKKIELTPTEFKILRCLTEKSGWVFSRDQLLDYLWGTEKAILDRTIDVHIKNLREKLGKAGKFVKNVRGMGYKLEE